MKKIYFIRHAKSSWEDESLSDFERGLNGRGKRDVVTMGKRLAKYNIFPDAVISSPAKRAKKTAKKICKEIGFIKQDIIYEASLYESSFEDYLEIIHSLSDDINSIFIIAHNPTITDVAERLGNIMIGNMPTCSICCVSFDVKDFKDIKAKEGKVVFFDFPKNTTLIDYAKVSTTL